MRAALRWLVQHPAGTGSVSFTLVAAALEALGVPDWVWIVVLVVGIGFGVTSVVGWLLGRRESTTRKVRRRMPLPDPKYDYLQYRPEPTQSERVAARLRQRREGRGDQQVATQAPIRIRIEHEPLGVIRVPKHGERSVMLSIRIDNEHPDDLEGVLVNVAVPGEVGLEVCGPDGSPSNKGRVVNPRPSAPDRYWQDQDVRLFGGGWTTEFNFKLTVSKPGVYPIKVSLRIPGFVSQIQYEKLTVEKEGD